MTPQQARLLDVLRKGAFVDFGSFLGRQTVTVAGYSGRVSKAMIDALRREGLVHALAVKSGQALPDGTTNKLRTTRIVYVARA